MEKTKCYYIIWLLVFTMFISNPAMEIAYKEYGIFSLKYAGLGIVLFGIFNILFFSVYWIIKKVKK